MRWLEEFTLGFCNCSIKLCHSETISVSLRPELEHKLELLKIEIDKGLRSIKEGCVVSADKVWQRILAEPRE